MERIVHQEQRARRNCLALLAEVARLGKEDGGNRFLVVGTLNEDLLGVIGGEEVWRLEAEKVLRRDGYSDRAGRWLETDGTREGEGGGGGEGMVAGVSVVYQKWTITPPSALGVPSSTLGPKRGGRGGCEDRQGMIEGNRTSTQKCMVAPSTTTDQKALPEGYHFSKVKREELQIVISRTEIPRTEETLARLGSVALRYRTPLTGEAKDMAAEGEKEEGAEAEAEAEAEADGGTLIAWAFLGVDCSFSSLHVEPEHRGKGLAKAVTRKLFEHLARDPLSVGFRPLKGDTVKVSAEDGAGWAHADVAFGNLESAGVVRGLGGKEGWEVRWVSVDLERVGLVVGEMRREESLVVLF